MSMKEQQDKERAERERQNRIKQEEEEARQEAAREEQVCLDLVSVSQDVACEDCIMEMGRGTGIGASGIGSDGESPSRGASPPSRGRSMAGCWMRLFIARFAHVIRQEHPRLGRWSVARIVMDCLGGLSSWRPRQQSRRGDAFRKRVTARWGVAGRLV